MNTSRHNFVTVNEILSDVLKLVDDERYETNSKGYYTSLIQQALEGLAFDTFFDERREDFEFPVDTLSLEMPIGAFNIKHIYLYTGTSCDITRSQKVWWKKNYYTNGNGYFADNKGNNSDPFFPSENLGIRKDALLVRPTAHVENHFFYNVQNGIIMFSSKCRVYPRVHVVYNGTGCDLGDIPIIPLFLREAVVDFTTEFTLRIKMAKPDGRQWAQLWQIYDKKLDRNGFDGSWHRAEMRVKTMSSAERNDLFEYLGKGQWQSGM